MLLPEKRKVPEEGREMARQFQTLRNWNLGIPDDEGEDEEEGLGVPGWLEREQEAEDDWYRNYGGLQKTRKIGLGPNDLSYRISGFEKEGEERPLDRPLRQDGTESSKDDDKFFGPDWREDYIAAVKRRDKDPFYIFLQKLAGATNTTVINLLSPPDVETRALRAGAIVEARKKDEKLRFEAINTTRGLLETAITRLAEQETEMGKAEAGQRIADNATEYYRRLNTQKELVEESTEDLKRLRDYTIINEAFTKLINAETPEYNEDLVTALDNRLKSFKPDESDKSAKFMGPPGLRGVDEKTVAEIQTQAARLFNSRTTRRTDRKNDVVFLGLWILYETRAEISEIVDSDPELFKTRVENLLGILSGTKKYITSDNRFEDAGERYLDFSITVEGADLKRSAITGFIRDNLGLLYTGSPDNVQTILEKSKTDAERELERNEKRMIDRGVEALRFNQNPLIEESVKNLPEIARFRQQTGAPLLLSVDKILVALEKIRTEQIKDKKTIMESLSKERNTVERLQAKIDRLLEPRDEDLEPKIPYRPEGTWVMDSMFTGWIPLAPIVVYGIEQAYQLVADHVPRLAASSPSDEEQIKKAIEVLETDPRYRAYFVQIVARQMGLSRQAFNVRWMPDLTGDHMRVIMYNIRKLRDTNGRNVDAHFQSALRSL
jgi:hypothetical protein